MVLVSPYRMIFSEQEQRLKYSGTHAFSFFVIILSWPPFTIHNNGTVASPTITCCSMLQYTYRRYFHRTCSCSHVIQSNTDKWRKCFAGSENILPTYQQSDSFMILVILTLTENSHHTDLPICSVHRSLHIYYQTYYTILHRQFHMNFCIILISPSLWTYSNPTVYCQMWAVSRFLSTSYSNHRSIIFVLVI